MKIYRSSAAQGPGFFLFNQVQGKVFRGQVPDREVKRVLEDP